MNTVQRLGHFRRRAVLLTAYGACALGIGMGVALAAAGSPPGAAPAAAPAVPAVSPENKVAAEAQYQKAFALYEQKKYAEAKVENDKALQLDPTHMQAILMSATLQKYLAGGTLPGATTQAGAAASGKVPLLTTQQVSLIRLMEMGNNERPIGRIDPKVVEDFWQTVMLKDPLVTNTPAAHNAFINPANFVEQAGRIRESRDIKYMEKVTVNNDPGVIITYRNNIQTYVLQNCATADCHGGDKGGKFKLATPATTPEAPYTNFYILAMYGNKDGKMVDRDNPEKSLMVQYGLPWASATIKHPKVEARKLSGVGDPRLPMMGDWIKKLVFPKPNYGFDYEVPGAAARFSAGCGSEMRGDGTPAPWSLTDQADDALSP